MSECSGKFYSQNGNFFSCNEFQDGFISKGNSFYEVIRVIEGKCVFLEDHLSRLENSITLSKNSKIEEGIIKKIILDFLQKSELKTGNIKLVINFYNQTQSIFLYQISHKYPDMDEYKMGVPVSLFYAERKDPNIKYIDAQLRSKINEDIAKKKVYEVLLVNENKCITEGSRSNVFFVKEDAVYTSPDEEVLSGITRLYVIKICKNLNIKFFYKNIRLAELSAFEATFLTGTSPKVLPVSNIDDFIYDAGNKVMKTIMNAYNEIIEGYIKNNK